MAISGTQIGYVRGYTQKIWLDLVQYLHFRILEFPLNRHHVETAHQRAEAQVELADLQQYFGQRKLRMLGLSPLRP